MIRELRNDARVAARALRRTPGITAAAVLCFALGIGATTAVFSVVNAVLLRPLPYANAGRLVYLTERDEQRGTEIPVSWPNFVDWREQNTVFDDMAPLRGSEATLTGGDEPERLTVMATSRELFSLLGVRPGMGRFFSPEEDRPGGASVIVLSHGLWERRFASDRRIIGSTIGLDGVPYTVIGVLPSDFAFWGQADVWTPIWPQVPGLQTRQTRSRLSVLARLGPGVSVARARDEMRAIARLLATEYPNANAGRTAHVASLREELVGDIRPGLLIFSGAVGLVLLIACANVANLLLSRGTARQREMAVRAALGADRRRLVRQLLVESTLLALVGAVAGVGIALAGIRLLEAAIPAEVSRYWAHFPINAPVLLFALAVGGITGVIAGITPALQVTAGRLHQHLAESARTATAGSARSRLRSALVVAETALALMLLIGATLLIQSFRLLQRSDPGFEVGHALTARIALSGARYASGQARIALFDAVSERLRAWPDVRAVGAIARPPFGGSAASVLLEVEGHPAPVGREPLVQQSAIHGDYLAAMGIPVVAGRALTTADDGNAPRVALINQTMAARLWPGESPIGRRVKAGSARGTEWTTVVGMVRDARQSRLDAPVAAEMYLPYAQRPAEQMTIVVRATHDPAALADAVRATLRAVDAALPVTAVRTMEETVSRTLWRRRTYGIVLAVFAAIALVLALVGVYQVNAYAVQQRSGEIGIRMAFGARSLDVLLLIVGHAARLTLLGLAVGLVGAAALTQVLANLLFGVHAMSASTFAGTAVVLGAASLLACVPPAYRAVRTDPATVLRAE